MVYYARMKIKLHGNTDLYALISAKDFSRVRQYKWYLSSSGYAITAHHRKGYSRSSRHNTVNIRMHQWVMGKPPEEGMQVDHKNRNRLDNSRGNLRWVTHHQNCLNKSPKAGCSSKYKGVSKTQYGTWAVQICSTSLGFFKDEKEAALVYDKAARFYGEGYAYLNFPDETYSGLVRYIDYQPDVNVKSQYRGVSFYRSKQKRVKRWRAIYKGKTIGYYLTEYEAHVAWEKHYESR